MFDNVKLKVDDLPENYNLFEYVKISYRKDEVTYMCKLKNLAIWQNRNYLTIYGSLAKYLQDENITPLDREGVKQAVKKLEQDIGLSLKNTVICSV